MVALRGRLACAAGAADVVRHPLPGGSTFPIARAVEVPAGKTIIFHSGTTPAPLDPKATPGTAAYWGDTKTQALSTFAPHQGIARRDGLASATSSR